MIESSKVVVKIEYERDGKTRVYYVEVDENKLEGFRARGESFLSVANDGRVAWLDKEAILSVSELETKLIAYEKSRLENEASAVKEGFKIPS
jgi:hypothetical protein